MERVNGNFDNHWKEYFRITPEDLQVISRLAPVARVAAGEAAISAWSHMLSFPDSAISLPDSEAAEQMRIRFKHCLELLFTAEIDEEYINSRRQLCIECIQQGVTTWQCNAAFCLGLIDMYPTLATQLIGHTSPS